MTTKNKEKTVSRSNIYEIRKKTRRKFSVEEKIRIVLEGLGAEANITDLCRREGIHPANFYKWGKTFLEDGSLWAAYNGDNLKEASSSEGKELRDEIRS